MIWMGWLAAGAGASAEKPAVELDCVVVPEAAAWGSSGGSDGQAPGKGDKVEGAMF